MNIQKRSSLISCLLVICAIPALAAVTVNTPVNGAQVATQFTLSATASNCSSQNVSEMGFSLDSSSNTTLVKGNFVDATVTSATGAHTLHVKAWGNSGAVCVTDVAITVVQSATNTTPPPATATSTAGINVTAPLNNATVGSPFTLDATATSCSSKSVSSMGYSLDDSSNTAVVTGQAVAASVTAAAGAHTLHVKSWGAGTSCVANVPITVTSASTSTTTSSGSNGVTITSPTPGQSVTSPFSLVANATSCSSQAIASIGWGIDSSTKTVATGGSLNTQISAVAGTHTLQITAWGKSGAICNANVSFDVTNPSVSATSLVPSDASSVSSIQVLSNWKTQHDTGTVGSSSGVMAMVSSPSLSGNARRFITTFANSGGQRYSDSFADDASATNVLYDAWVYVSSTGQSSIANLEMDTNQVMSNGQTVIYAFQCSGYAGVWEYSKNAGTPAKPVVQWVKSSAACNVRNWAANTWHHVQVYYSRDNAGNVTYHSVWLDGTETQINATVPGAFALGWGQVMVTNFQVDGLGTSGSNTLYLDNLTISRW